MVTLRVDFLVISPLWAKRLASHFVGLRLRVHLEIGRLYRGPIDTSDSNVNISRMFLSLVEVLGNVTVTQDPSQ